ncbi:hypothetical protein Pelo_19649 [Pelomyxa schiedti]|nr:hypothetical protein Pelo_19649 [Pelomyxa schiedti]
MLVGNKCDLESRRLIPTETAQTFADQFQMPYIECSALTGNNVEAALTQMVTGILGRGPDPHHFPTTVPRHAPPPQTSCC